MTNVWNIHTRGSCIIWFDTHYRCLRALGTRIIYECSIYLAFICGWSDLSYFESNLWFCFLSFGILRDSISWKFKIITKIHQAIDISSVFSRKRWARWNAISGSISYLKRFFYFFLWLPFLTFFASCFGSSCYSKQRPWSHTFCIFLLNSSEFQKYVSTYPPCCWLGCLFHPVFFSLLQKEVIWPNALILDSVFLFNKYNIFFSNLFSKIFIFFNLFHINVSLF